MFTKEFLAKNKDQKNNQKSVKNIICVYLGKYRLLKQKTLHWLKMADANCR